MTQSIKEAELAEKRRYWKQHLKDWSESGLSQVDYCREQELSRHQFQYWKKKYQPVQSSAALIELQLRPDHEAASGHLPLRLIVGRYQVAVERDFDPATLRQLISFLSRL